jgi:hypothetical protein
VGVLTACIILVFVCEHVKNLRLYDSRLGEDLNSEHKVGVLLLNCMVGIKHRNSCTARLPVEC